MRHHEIYDWNVRPNQITTDNELVLADDLNTLSARLESLDNSSKCTDTLKAVTQTEPSSQRRMSGKCSTVLTQGGAVPLKSCPSELATVWQPILQTPKHWDSGWNPG